MQRLVVYSAAIAAVALSLGAYPVRAASVAAANILELGRAARLETPVAFVRRGGFVRGPRGGAVVHRGGAYVGPRGGVVVHRGTVAVGPRGRVAVRGGTVVRGGWARPGAYWWRPGAAVAAGAAVGFVSAATAVAWAGAAPGPGMCWYYTNASRTKGFWDVCP